jgi:hypothetical protein
MATNIRKIDQLIQRCTHYQAHLDRSIKHIVNGMPSSNVAYCKQNGQIDISILIDRLNNSWNLNQGSSILSRVSHPDLHSALYKYQIVTDMMTILNSDTNDATQKISAITNLLDEDYKTARVYEKSPGVYKSKKDILEDRRYDTMGAKFLENVLHVLTLGLYSKYSKGTFKFWKTHGQAVVDEITETAKKITNNNTTPQ